MAGVLHRQPLMSLPLSTGDTRDVQTQDRQGAEHDHSGDCVDPRADVWGQDDRYCAGTEVESKLDSNACHDDVRCATNGENDAFQRASFRWARPPPPQTPVRSAFQRGWVGGRSKEAL